ncbi:ROK family protein [Microbacterium gorillae]|uniref:ROK family protein n=1 Tax=Microbacterium gorillae TaxID=1231063 RepID=UPI00058B3581|nr:ROK family protein [Microbacterium gorillae]
MSATTTEDVRRSNLSRILRALHVQGPRSRAALTALTGLNRSTVGALTAELGRAGLVREGDPETAVGAGRPSPVFSAASDVVTIAVNPEVDAVTLAVVGLDRVIRVRERVPLSRVPTPDEVTALVGERLAAWRADALAACAVVSVGVAVPGLVRSADGLVRLAPHLGWADVPLAENLADHVDLPVVVANDATLGAIAEHRYGAGLGHDDVLYLNGGASGIGGGIISRGAPLEGAGGYAGEFGHIAVATADRDDLVTSAAVLEDEVSRRHVLELLDRTGDDIDDAELAALLSDPASAAVSAELDRQRRVLAAALASAVNVMNPSAVVLGGYLAALVGDPERFRELVVRSSLPVSGEDLTVAVAALAADRLLIGAAEAALEPLLADPLSAAPHVR